MKYLIIRNNYPKEIISFLEDLFEIYEIRGRVGQENGVVFNIRTNEKNHNIAHVHAEYGDYNVSIRIDNGEVLAGTLPKKKQRIAKEWVLKNKENLLTKWSEIAISATSTMTKSRLDLQE